MNKMKLLLTLAIPVLLSQDTQAQSSRLTAQAHWMHNGAEFKLNDSTAYNYFSTTRGGDLNHQLNFDDATNWSYTMGDTQNNNMRYVQEFDANNNLTVKVSQEWDAVSTFSWVNKWKNIYTYNSSNMLVSMVVQHWDGTSAWITDSKNVYQYNAANQLYQDQYQLWDGISSYVNSSQITYYYDIDGNMINSTGVQFVGGAPVFTTQVNYTFNSDKKELTATHSMWNGASWDNTEKFTNTYDSASNRLTRLHQTYDGTGFVNDMLDLYSNFDGSNPQQQITQMWDTTGGGFWADTYKYALTYNANGQLTSSSRQSNDISIGWTNTFGDTKDNYYYGTYVSVKSVSNHGGTANMYPVPAESLLNIDLNWNVSQASTLTISDMQGRVIKTQSIPAAKNFVSVSVADFATGIYTVRLNGTDGQIVKQIVVSH